MKIAENIKTDFAEADPTWSQHTADLAHAIIERALSMSPSDLREFVTPTQNGGAIATATDDELSAMAAMARNALL